MIRFSDTGPCVDVHSYLVAFCALAVELYPDEDWVTVEPKLARSWERYIGEGLCEWKDVRESARTRWEARSIAPA